MPADVRIAHIGGPTALIEIAGLRLLTDPTFDAPGRRYSFGWGSASHKTAGPAIEARDLPPIDAVLLSHDQHGDNLDDAGRALLPSAGTVLTTPSGAGRLGGTAVGLEPWQTHELYGTKRVRVLATPARHGPPLSRPITGEVTGFALLTDDAGAVWVSGDTVLYDGVRQVASRVDVDVAVMHLGAVRFGITGPVRYTMTAREALSLVDLVKPRAVVPVHYEGWGHFHEGRPAIEAAFGADDRLTWLTPGKVQQI
jgi:L-ascorbate metabolism protein UlaG (beta-lactamase superfamily)